VVSANRQRADNRETADRGQTADIQQREGRQNVDRETADRDRKQTEDTLRIPVKREQDLI
jgi:hypothetical protein